MKTYGAWQVEILGETYRWEPDEVTPGEEVLILSECDYDSYEAWIEGINAREAIACQVLIWFLRRKAGRQDDRLSVQIPHRKIAARPLDDEPVDSPEASAGSDSPTSEPATSSPSSTGTESDPGNGAS